MIQERLDNEIFSHVYEHLREAKLIVMHPRTWMLLRKEVLNDALLRSYNIVGEWVSSVDGASSINHLGLNTLDGVLKYKGIKVLRSVDVKECFFEIG